MMGTDRQTDRRTDGQTQVTTITLRPKRPRVNNRHQCIFQCHSIGTGFPASTPTCELAAFPCTFVIFCWAVLRGVMPRSCWLAGLPTIKVDMATWRCCWGLLTPRTGITTLPAAFCMGERTRFMVFSGTCGGGMALFSTSIWPARFTAASPPGVCLGEVFIFNAFINSGLISHFLSGLVSIWQRVSPREGLSSWLEVSMGVPCWAMAITPGQRHYRHAHYSQHCYRGGEQQIPIKYINTSRHREKFGLLPDGGQILAWFCWYQTWPYTGVLPVLLICYQPMSEDW